MNSVRDTIRNNIWKKVRNYINTNIDDKTYNPIWSTTRCTVSDTIKDIPTYIKLRVGGRRANRIVFLEDHI